MPQRNNGSGRLRKLEVRPHRLPQKELDAVIRKLKSLKNPLNRLRAMQELLAHDAALIEEWVQEARDEGETWDKIGDALGITRQSAWERFGKR